MKSILKTLGSLNFALFLIASLGVILTVSTLLESAYGTPFAQKTFYQTRWFDFFLMFFAVNIFCSTLTRLPFKKHHTGFIVTHIGILTLLAGSLLTRILGIEGQVALYEGESSAVMRKEGYELLIHTDKNQTYGLDLKKNKAPFSRKLRLSGNDMEIHVKEILENAQVKESIKEGDKTTPSNRGVELTLQSDMAGVNTDLLLVEKNPFDPSSKQISFGMANVILADKKPENSKNEDVHSPILRIEQKSSGQVYRVDITPNLKPQIPLGDSGLQVVQLTYYPDARVENSKLVNLSQNPVNPAVQFEVVDKNGVRERHTKFALFPEFESLHGKDAKSAFDITVDFLVPALIADAHDSKTPSLVFFPLENGQWGYATTSSKSSSEGTIELDKEYATGWMDFKFRVKKTLAHAVVLKEVRKGKELAQGRLATQVVVKSADKILAEGWVLPGVPLAVEVDDKQGFALSLDQKAHPLPFSLLLKDFRKVDYPGTQNPASFESDVALEDQKDKKIIHQTISMNQPMDYKGYRIFQSSYAQDPQVGEASIFTVAKNPGIKLIYGGACILFTGVILVFYVKPFSSLGHKKDKVK